MHHRIRVAAGVDQIGQFPRQRIGPLLCTVRQRRLHEDKTTKRNAPCGGVKRQKRARGIAVGTDLPTDGIDQRRKILHLPVRRIRQRVAAFPPAAAIVAAEGEVRGQKWHQVVQGAEAPVVPGRFDEDQRGTVSGTLKRNLRSIPGRRHG